jgi:hypothetical protein
VRRTFRVRQIDSDLSTPDLQTVGLLDHLLRLAVNVGEGESTGALRLFVEDDPDERHRDTCM